MSGLTSKAKDGWARWKLAHFYLRDIQDVDVSSTLPVDGDTLVWVDADKKWEPGAGSSVTLRQLSHIRDDFTRTNSSTGLGKATITGQSWTALTANNLGILSNQAYSPTGSAIEVVDCASADGIIEVDLASDRGGCVFRAVDSSNYFGVERDSIFKVVAGAATAIHNWTVNWPGHVQVVMDGDSIVVRVNGSVQAAVSFTDSFNNTTTTHGLYADNSSYVATRFEFWSA